MGPQVPPGPGVVTGLIIAFPESLPVPAGYTALGTATLSDIDMTNHKRSLTIKYLQKQ